MKASNQRQFFRGPSRPRTMPRPPTVPKLDLFVPFQRESLINQILINAFGLGDTGVGECHLLSQLLKLVFGVRNMTVVYSAGIPPCE